MINNPDTREPAPQSGKLVLPAPPVEEQRAYSGTQLRPEQLILRRTQPAPKGTVSKLTYYWRKDPAYKVLINPCNQHHCQRDDQHFVCRVLAPVIRELGDCTFGRGLCPAKYKLLRP